MDELVSSLKGMLSEREVSKDYTGHFDDYLYMSSKYLSIRIDKNNFHEIKSYTRENHNGVDSQNIDGQNNVDTNILFVDGGNSILFESAGLCVGVIRVGGIIYSNNKRVKRQLEEFYVIITEMEGKYIVKTYPDTTFNNISFDPDDESLRNGLERCSVTRILSILRRFAEIDYAFNNSREVNHILLDGTLEARYPLEEKYLKRLFSTGKACALSKTCSLTTKKGFSITKILHDLSPVKAWYYNPVIINNNPRHDAEMYFVKLNENSKYVFRFEIQKQFINDVHTLFLLLAYNSKDPVFLGYPYGLIDIDQYVRVSDEESELLRTRMSMKFGKDWIDFSKHLNSMNAHSVLDKIRF